MSLINKKLIEILRTFSDSELIEFKKLVNSPIYTHRKNYIPILNQIIVMMKKGLEDFSSAEIYSKVYHGKRFNNQTMRNRLSELFKLSEEFIIFKNLDKNEAEKDKILLKEFLEKKLYKLFESKYARTKAKIDSMPDNDEKFRYISFLNEINLTLLNKKSKRESMYKQYYSNTEYLVCTFLIDLFQRGIEFILQENDGIKIDNNIATRFLNGMKIDGFMKDLERKDSKIFKVLRMHYNMYKAFENDNEEKYYFEARKIFNEINSYFSSEYKNEFYKTMINYCIIRQNLGIKKFQYELFELYNDKLEQGLYSELRAQMFPVNIFRDYVYIGLQIRRYKWVEDFINRYSKELPKETREDEINLSYAKLYFDNSHFEKSLERIYKVRGINYLHYGDSSVLKLCCYYELGRYEESFFEIDKFRHYLKNHNEIPKIHKDFFSNFLSAYTQIVLKKSKPLKSDLGLLEKKINQYKEISKKAWLLEKVSAV